VTLGGDLVTSQLSEKKTTVRRSFLRLFFAAAALASTVAFPASSASAAYPPGPLGPFVFVVPSSQTVAAGTEFTVTVFGCEPGKPCAITFNPTVNAECVNGRATATFRAPCEAGIYPISAVVRGKTYTSYITVTGSCDGVPATGISTLPTALSLGLGTLATGIVLLVATRSRHRLRLAH